MRTSPRQTVRTALLVLAVAFSAARPASAQFAVFDAATTARNRTTAALKELLYRLQIQEHDKLLLMARRLSALTSLRRFALTDVPRWRVHGSADFPFVQSYLDTLNFGDRSGAAYLALVERLAQSPRLGRLPPAARRSVISRLATIDLADAVVIAGSNGTGQLRNAGRRLEIDAIDALERDVIDPSIEQSTTAVLDKISGAALIGARQRQARIQLLAGVLEQLLLDTKQLRDVDAANMNSQLVTWRDKAAVDAAFVAGSGDALRTWRQP
ncbi:MAG: hypothetical protein AB7I04_24835 [Pseudomonadales bacterium]